MPKSKIANTALVLGLLTLSSCGPNETTTSVTQSEISGSTDLVPASLGKGFDSLTQTIKGKCVTGTPVWAGAPEADVAYLHDLDFDTLLVNFNGGINVGAKIALFEIKGAGEYASKNAADEFSSTVSLVNNITIKKKVLDELRLDEAMRPYIVSGGKVSPDVRTLCGDEFVSTAVYGASLIVNAKFSFKSREDKKEFNASAGLSLAQLSDLGELGGKIGRLNSRLKTSSQVTISARQVGGDPEKLASILASEVVSCNLAAFEEKCLPMLTRLIEYARDTENGFRSGLGASPEPDAKETAKGWAQLRFITTPFEDEPIEGKFLVTKTGTPALSDEIRDARDEVYSLNRISVQDLERAAILIKNYNLSDEQLKSLQDLQSAISRNKIDLAALTKLCIKKPDQCVKELERYKTRAFTYDPALLEMKPPVAEIPVEEPVQKSAWTKFWERFAYLKSCYTTFDFAPADQCQY